MGRLVRDKIPEIIKASGKDCKTHVAQDDEYREALHAKLREEVGEFLAVPSRQELADVMEVVEAIAEVYGGLAEEREKKRKERGAFSKRIILEDE